MIEMPCSWNKGVIEIPCSWFQDQNKCDDRNALLARTVEKLVFLFLFRFC